MKISTIILISIVTACLSCLFLYNYAPIGQINELNGSDMLGSTITTINGSDTLKNSRSVINTNFSNLNSDKIETSATSLPLITTLSGLTTAGSLSTIGTITTGTWNANTLTVAYGGTGSTTLLSNAVLLGNGTSGIKAVPAGSNDQVLTLVAGVPVWQSGTIDETLSYDWTGEHSFSATTTFNASTTWNVLPEYTTDPTDDNDAVRKSYVDANDFSLSLGSTAPATSTITKQYNWIDWDISSIVGAKRTMVFFRVDPTVNGTGICIRPNGSSFSSTSGYSANCFLDAADSKDGMLVTYTDDNGVVELYSKSTDNAGLYIAFYIN
jgi:hypothetical protein